MLQLDILFIAYKTKVVGSYFIMSTYIFTIKLSGLY